MLKYFTAGFILVSGLVFTACSRKTTPTTSSTNTTVIPEKTSAATKTADSVAIVEMKAKMGIKAPVKTAVPKSIVVNDAAAKKTVSGRYYYDLEGKRYWRNKKDGKYYLYYKGMFDDKDFQ